MCEVLPRGGRQRVPRPPGARPGIGPWWSQRHARRPAKLGLAEVRAAFDGRPPAPPGSDDDAAPAAPGPATAEPQPGSPAGGPAPAAVLCALFDAEGQAAVVLTRRSSQLRSHTGEVSFPGGRIEPGETPTAAALREADEEVGIPSAAVEVLGRLPPVGTHSSATSITPVVGVLPAAPALRPNPAEVARAFTVTLIGLMEPGVYHQELWADRGAERPVHFFELPGDTVWGATAGILVGLLSVVCPTPP